ncbi:hypothetical protein BZA70DRAFT_166999 [Myxozyma melibiosi]|uniref:E3 ubiquitin-protein ligase listerin n=1 Tax=Myxozyma melibiosi TaxID=54550 RepID=A0ABR1F798_9ASCO
MSKKLKVKNNPRGGDKNKHSKGDQKANQEFNQYADNSASSIDLSAIYDPQLVVIFRGLQKRDPKTKEKALDNLVAYISESEDQIDESILIVWVQFYPQLAVDFSKRQRMLAHKIQGDLFKLFQRQSARYLKDSIGPWLGGIYDSDKSVSRAAVSSFESVFATEEKRKQVFQLFHAQLLEFVKKAISAKDTHSASDEKYFSETDLELRVTREISAGITLFSYLLDITAPEAIQEQQTDYAEIITSDTVWKSITSSDAYLARACLTLIMQLTYNYFDWLKPLQKKFIGQYLIANGLMNISTGAISEFLECLVIVTRFYPESWDKSPESGEPSMSLLLSFISQGSRFSGPKFWQHIELLIEKLPTSTLDINDPKSISMTDISEAFKNGMMAENRMTVDAAADAYLSLLAYVLTVSDSADVRASAFNEALEIFQEYIAAESSFGKKIATDGVARSIGSFLRNVIPEKDELAIDFWKTIVASIKTLVENPIDTDATAFKSKVARWISLAKRVGTIPAEFSERIEFSSSIRTVIKSALDMVRNLDGAVVLSAFALEALLKEFLLLVKSDADTFKIVDEFVIDTIPSIISSASSTHLINIWLAFELGIDDASHTARSWASILSTVLASSFVETKDDLLVYLLQQIKPLKTKITRSEALEEYIAKKSESVFENGKQRDWDVIVECLLSSQVISPDCAVKILKDLAKESLYDVEYETVFFQNLLKVAQKNFSALAAFIGTEDGTRFTSRLWQITESPDDSSEAAKAIRQRLEGQLNLSKSSESSGLLDSLANSILRDVETNPEPTCDSLLARSISLWENAGSDIKPSLARRLLFPTGSWRSVIDVAFSRPLSPSISLLNSLGGTMYLCTNTESGQVDIDSAEISFSFGTASNDMRLYRMASYVLQLNEKIDIFSFLPYKDQLEQFLMLQQTAELAKDSINAYGSGVVPPLFAIQNLSNGSDGLLLITEKANNLLETKCGLVSLSMLEKSSIDGTADDKVLPETSKDDVQFITDFVSEITKLTRARSTPGFYAARVLESLVAYLAEDPEFSSKDADALFDKLELRRAKDKFSSIAFFEGMSKYIGTMTTTDRLRNEVASDILGLRPATIASVGLEKVITLNSLVCNVLDESVTLFPPQRAIMLLRRVLDMLPEGSGDNIPLRAEATKLLAAMLPTVKEMYGEHWSRILGCLVESLRICEEQVESEEITPLLYHSLKVLVRVKSFQSENDDIADALAEDVDISDALLRILAASVNLSQRSQSRLLCDTALSRQILDIPSDKIADPVPLYPILAVESEPLQRTIFKLAGRAIPVLQESLAVEAALDTHGVFNIEIPAELLSFVMSVPEAVEGDFVLEDVLAAGMTCQMRTYLYSWKLIFEYLEHAPFALKTKYIMSLKEGDYIESLLNLLASLLSLDSGKPVDVSKFPFAKFDPDEDMGSSTRELQWVLLHIYYMCLYQLPSIVRKWWSEIRNRQLSIAVEKFTQQYFSPALIDSELHSVQNRLAESGVAADDENIQVKVNYVLREVAAIYTIDEQTMGMVVQIPSSFPLHDVHVDGIKRVGVKENQWRAWLLASQSVITSQNGTIVDALSLFRRNVSLHFEGVTECAICYSILHQDRSLPSKKCQTCKNKFHAGCLFKWFQSANASTCPLCRQPFTFGR